MCKYWGPCISVTEFVDDMLVGTETKKEHNEIIKEILKRLEKNNFILSQKSVYGDWISRGCYRT